MWMKEFYNRCVKGNMNINIVNKCSICDEILNGDQAGLYYLYAKSFLNNVESRILYENEKFIVMPSLGPVAECHLLVLPKKHICSYAVWNQESLCEAEELIRKISDIVRKRYGSSIVFEHGTLGEDMQGSASCVHAHMHIVSCSKSLYPYFKKDKLELRKIGRLSELIDQKQRRCPYFFYQENEATAYVMDDMIQKSQYIRFLIADILEKPDCGDWKKNPGILEVNKMILEMKKDFQDLF